MVWLHGGGLHAGSASSPLYDGEALSKRGDVVVVTVNHRVGLLGHLHLAPFMGEPFRSSGMVGMLDIVQALRWVEENISSFGGDPGKVTIFGQSGGAQKIAAIMAMPDASGLFHRVAIQSGGMMRAGARMDPEELAGFVLGRLEVRPGDAEKIQTLPFEQIVDVGIEVAERFGPMVVNGAVDGVALPDHPEALLSAGASSGVPLLIGATANEFRSAMPADLPLTDQHLIGLLGGVLGRKDTGSGAKESITMYRATLPKASNAELFGEIFTGYVHALVSRIADLKVSSGAAPVYSYVFSEPPAHHCDELRYLFRWGTEGRLADVVSDAWLAFARHGDPSHDGLPTWAPFDIARRNTMILTQTPHPCRDPLGPARETWELVDANF
jgi:para-nitrobenzyl esterase